jgi:Fur family transcriptional regulator, peroxide stress response regulator
MTPMKAPAARSSRDRDGDALRARGLKLTAPRQVILDAVRATATHPSAGIVYRDVRRRLPRVSLATVYRNLRMLAAEGLLRERADATGLRFDGNTARHDHFTCVGCGRIYDVPTLSPSSVRRRVAVRTGFEVLDHRVEFYGRCRQCRRGRPRTGPTRRARGGRGPRSRTDM